MAANGDDEDQAIASEQTPLLDGGSQAAQGQTADDDERPDPKTEEARGHAASWYLWRIFWAVVAALILAVFIKGWIDAGADGDVRARPLIYLSAHVANLALRVVRPEGRPHEGPRGRPEWCSSQ